MFVFCLFFPDNFTLERNNAVVTVVSYYKEGTGKPSLKDRKKKLGDILQQGWSWSNTTRLTIGGLG
jgi:hypothetical protein